MKARNIIQALWPGLWLLGSVISPFIFFRSVYDPTPNPMKQTRRSFLKSSLATSAFILGLWAACSLANAQDEGLAIRALTGKWRLVEYYNDIGDGKGHLNWQKADDKTAQTLEFRGDGTFILTTAVPNPHGHSKGKYVLEKAQPKNSVIRFTWSEPAVAGEIRTWSSSIVVLKADRLELSGPGIEGSGSRYSRVK